MKLPAVLLASAVFAVSAAAAVVTAAAPAAPAVQLAGRAEQGGIMRGTLPPGATAPTLDGRPVKTGPDGRFLIGFGRDAAATAVLAWQAADGAPAQRLLTITPRQWRVQSLPTLPPRPVPDAEFDARRPAELAQIAAARAVIGDGTAWQGRFVIPARGPITGVYGAQRILAGTPSAPHAGLDIGAATGAPVVAPAAGTVRLAAGPFTLEGNLVMIDHGFGLVSALLHLSRIDVRPGEVVARGQRIGTAGATGRATGPHLHWGVTWTDVRIDPAALLQEPPR